MWPLGGVTIEDVVIGRRGHWEAWSSWEMVLEGVLGDMTFPGLS